MKQTDAFRPALVRLTDQQFTAFHEASLRILAQTGVNVHSRLVRDLLRAAGAEVEGDLRVRIPPGLVEGALATAPPRIDIYDRAGILAMALEGTRSYFGTGSDLHHTLDATTGGRRPSTLRDVALAAALCDDLANIDFVMSYALPADVPPADVEVEQARAMFEHTRKPPIVTVSSGADALRRIHALACDRCGGPEAFPRAPNYIVYSQFVSPLQHDALALERLVFCADQHIPLIYVPTIMMGATGPVTLAGAIALANAECLAGLVFHQLRVPGAPFIYGGCVSPLDMRTTVFAYGAPEWRLADIVLAQLSLRYGLPAFGTAGASDAMVPDAQAGAEWASSLLASALAGTNLIHDVGYLESGLTGSLEALVIGDEIVGMVKRLLAGVELSAEALATEVIDGVGPAGQFVDHPHTLAHFRTVWYPAVFHRERWSDGEQRGGEQRGGEHLIQRARRRVESLLAKRSLA